MRSSPPIEIPIEQAEDMVEPESLDDVLQSLKSNGFIDHFVIREATVLIWSRVQRKFEVAFFSEQASHFEPILTKKRKQQ